MFSHVGSRQFQETPIWRSWLQTVFYSYDMFKFGCCSPDVLPPVFPVLPGRLWGWGWTLSQFCSLHLTSSYFFLSNLKLYCSVSLGYITTVTYTGELALPNQFSGQWIIIPGREMIKSLSHEATSFLFFLLAAILKQLHSSVGINTRSQNTATFCGP